MPAHLTQPQRVRALSLLEAGISQGEVAKRLQVSRWTIARLQKIKVSDPSQVERRKAGTGLKNKKYGSKEVNAISRLLDKNSFLTSFQLKLMLRKTLQNLSPRTIRRIIVEELKMPAAVAARKPRLTEEKKVKRMDWCKKLLRKKKQFWNEVIYVDEVMFSTKASTGGRLVRRPKGASRSDPKYTKQVWRRGQKQMAVCGFTSSGERFLHFLPRGKRMTAKLYTKVVAKEAVSLVRRQGLTILQDRARVHTAKLTRAFMEKEQVDTLFLPATSPDLQPIENLFGYLKMVLQQRPTRTLKQMRAEVRAAWRNLSTEHLQQLSSSMTRRMREVIKGDGEMSDY